MIARWLCWLGLHRREIVTADAGERGSTLPMLFAFECARCRRQWRRIPGREWEPL